MVSSGLASTADEVYFWGDPTRPGGSKDHGLCACAPEAGRQLHRPRNDSCEELFLPGTPNLNLSEASLNAQ